MSSEKIWDLVVIGGGPAGMMAALQAARRGKRVCLLEKNRQLGEKLKLTGGGRCNITNALFDPRSFLEEFGEFAKYLYSPFSTFAVSETFDFFEELGLELEIEALNRVFPKSQRADDVCRILEEALRAEQVNIRKGEAVLRIVHNDQRIEAVETHAGRYTAHAFLIATGGLSYPKTGSTGDGLNWLKELGHTIIDPNPNLVPLAVKERWIAKLSGVTLDPMRIGFYQHDQCAFSKTGRLLFTHFGLSGPLILNSSYRVRKLLETGPVEARIDLKPHLDHRRLDQEIIDCFEQNKNKILKNVIKPITPDGMHEIILEQLTQTAPDTRINSMTRSGRKELVDLLKSFPLTIKGLMGYDWAIVSDGGVPLEEVDTKTMRSRLIDNLYLAGDVLHINRPSGGFSLQLCWTTGYVVGQSI